MSALADSADAGMIVDLDVKSNINLEGNGVIPAVVKGIPPMNLPVAEEVSITPRFGPSRLLDCPRQQGQITCLNVLQQAVQNDHGATPAHGDGHRQGKRSAMLHFRTREADFKPSDIDENGEVKVKLLYAIERQKQTDEAFVGTDVVKGVIPMN